jgi:hypothetical protein
MTASLGAAGVLACIASLTMGSWWKSPVAPPGVVDVAKSVIPANDTSPIALASKPDFLHGKYLDIVDSALESIVIPPTGDIHEKLPKLDAKWEVTDFGKGCAWTFLASLLIDLVVMLFLRKGRRSDNDDAAMCDAAKCASPLLIHAANEESNEKPPAWPSSASHPLPPEHRQSLGSHASDAVTSEATTGPSLIVDHRLSNGSRASDVDSETPAGFLADGGIDTGNVSILHDGLMSDGSFPTGESDMRTSSAINNDVNEEAMQCPSSAPVRARRTSACELKAWMEKKREACEVVESEQVGQTIPTDARASDGDTTYTLSAPTHGQTRGRRRSAQDLRALMEKKRDECQELGSTQESVEEVEAKKLASAAEAELALAMEMTGAKDEAQTHDAAAECM